MIHPDTALQFINEPIGYGVTATRLIPQGTVVWIQDELDIEIDAELFATLPDSLKKIIDHHAFINPKGHFVLCWDAGRYVNHSCKPSTVSIGNFCTIAARDILPGEEITEDYATLNIPQSLHCLCGAENCRGHIHADDLPKIARQLDLQAKQAIGSYLKTQQALTQIFKPEHRRILEKASRQQGYTPSCLDNRQVAGL